MKSVDIDEAKARLSEWVDAAAAGEDVVVCRNGRPVARITQLEPTKRVIKLGVLKGQIRVSADFDAPLPDEVLAGFEGR